MEYGKYLVCSGTAGLHNQLGCSFKSLRTKAVDAEFAHINDLVIAFHLCYPRTRTISLSGNSIKKITAEIFANSSSLTKVILSYNPLDHIDKDSFLGTNLEYLDVSFTQLTTKSREPLLLGRGYLKILYATHTNIATDLQALRIMRCEGRIHFTNEEDVEQYEMIDCLNGLVSKAAIPGECLWSTNGQPTCYDQSYIPCVGRSTQELTLTSNTIEDLSPLGCYPNLKKLRIPSGQVKSIGSATFNNNLLLTELDLSYNPVTDIDADAFVHLPMLKILVLRGTKVSKLNIKSSSLEKLDISKTRIREPDDISLKQLPSLTHLDISENQLTRLGRIADSSKLVFLYACHNPFSDCCGRNIRHFGSELVLNITQAYICCGEQADFDEPLMEWDEFICILFLIASIVCTLVVLFRYCAIERYTKIKK